MGTILSLLVAVSLVALGLRAKYHHAGAGDDHDSQTYCYTGVQTLHSDQPVAQCFTVANGLFTAVASGDEPELKRRGSDDAAAVKGFVIPGLWDGHGHLVDYGEMLVNVDLFGVATLDDMRARLRDHIAQHPGSGTKERWLRGIGWDQTDFGRMPTAVRTEKKTLALSHRQIFVCKVRG